MANFVRDFVAEQPRDRLALVTLEPERREWTFGELYDNVAVVAANFAKSNVRRESVVLTLVGNTFEYVTTMLACMWIGAVVLPCSEQLRRKDIAMRVRRTNVNLMIVQERNRRTVSNIPVRSFVAMPSAESRAGLGSWRLAFMDPPPYAELEDTDPAFMLFTSGTTGSPKRVTHGQRYVWGQQLQAREWLAAEPGELVWSTAAPGWSKSTRNGFITPWLCGAAALLHDGRFDPAERLRIIRDERVNVLCMAPTEYRLIAAHGPIDVGPSLRRMVTAGEALGAATIET